MSALNLKDYPRPFYAINQFCQPHCTELEGKSFYFVMDGGYDYELKITGPKTCEWNRADKKPAEATYECLKADDTTYMLDYDIMIGRHRANHLFIIDLEQSLVTMIRCEIGCNPKFPLLVKSDYDFGAIRVEGQELPTKRHCFTGEMMGTTVEWHWNITMWTQHNYYSPAYYRITWPQQSTAVSTIGKNFEVLPSSDEISQYVKIKENMYAYCLTEEMMERKLGASGMFRSNNMVFIQNYDRMYHVGRTFGSMTFEGKTRPCRTLFGAFGNPIRLEHDWKTAENPYTV